MSWANLANMDQGDMSNLTDLAEGVFTADDAKVNQAAAALGIQQDAADKRRQVFETLTTALGIVRMFLPVPGGAA